MIVCTAEPSTASANTVLDADAHGLLLPAAEPDTSLLAYGCLSTRQQLLKQIPDIS